MEWFCAAKGGAECSGAETERKRAAEGALQKEFAPKKNLNS